MCNQFDSHNYRLLIAQYFLNCCNFRSITLICAKQTLSYINGCVPVHAYTDIWLCGYERLGTISFLSQLHTILVLMRSIHSVYYSFTTDIKFFGRETRRAIFRAKPKVHSMFFCLENFLHATFKSVEINSYEG